MLFTDSVTVVQRWFIIIIHKNNLNQNSLWANLKQTFFYFFYLCDQGTPGEPGDRGIRVFFLDLSET